jgi:hypothetical protein
MAWLARRSEARAKFFRASASLAVATETSACARQHGLVRARVDREQEIPVLTMVPS